MIDHRYPNLFRVAEAPRVSSTDRKRAAAIFKRVAEVTRCYAAYNAETGGVYFYNIDPAIGLTEHPFADPCNGQVKRWPTQTELEQLIRRLNSRFMPSDEKQAEVERSEAAAKAEAKARADKELDDSRKDRVDRVKHTTRGRVSALVSK